MLKSLAKFILPPVLRKKIFLFYNILKAKTIDKLVYSELPVRREHFLVYTEVNPFLKMDIAIDRYPKDIQHGLRLWTDPLWTQNEYLFVLEEPGYIDAKTGWALTTKKKLVYPSLGFARAVHVRKPAIGDIYGKKDHVHFDKIVSLRDTGEENYFHFFNDVLPKLFFLRDHGIDLRRYTIVVSEKLYKKEYFQYYFANTWIGNLAWYVQQLQSVSFSEAVFCKPLTHTRKYFTEGARMKASDVTQTERRVFLNRNSRSLRYIKNFEEIRNVLDRYHFEVVDTGSLQFVSQRELFAQCRYLIGIHGAGLTNMIFRGDEPLSLLEIMHPFNYIPFHYIMLAKQFGHEYDVILGKTSKASAHGGFYVDPDQFEHAVRKMLHA